MSRQSIEGPRHSSRYGPSGRRAGNAPSLSNRGHPALFVADVASTAACFISVFMTGAERLETTNLNFVAGQTVPNLMVAKLGANGNVDLNGHFV
jgi:hypothetical protein